MTSWKMITIPLGTWSKLRELKRRLKLGSLWKTIEYLFEKYEE